MGSDRRAHDDAAKWFQWARAPHADEASASSSTPHPYSTHTSAAGDYRLTRRRAWRLRAVQAARCFLFLAGAAPFWIIWIPFFPLFVGALGYFSATLINPALADPNNPAELADFRGMVDGWIACQFAVIGLVVVATL